MAFIVGVFPPSANLMKVLASYIYLHLILPEEDPVAQLAKFSMRRLQRTAHKGTRKLIPGIVELDAIRNKKPIICRFDFLDGNKKALYIDSAATVNEVFSVLAEKVGLQDPTGFCIYEVYNNKLERSLTDDDNLADAIAKFEKYERECREKNMKVTFKFVFKKRLFLDPSAKSEDPVENSLLFYQAYTDILEGRLPCEVQQAIDLGALKLQIDYGPYDPSRTISEPTRYIPKSIFYKQTANEWEKGMLKQHGSLGNISKDEAKLNYLEKAKSLKLYGTALFSVQHKSEWDLPSKFELGVSVRGLLFLSTENRRLELTFPYSELDNYYYTTKSIKLFFTASSAQRTIELITLQGVEIISLIKDYITSLQQESVWARAVTDYHVNDPELLPFDKGDVIYILNRDEIDWFVGVKINNPSKKGSFPSNHVELMVAPPPGFNTSEEGQDPSSALTPRSRVAATFKAADKSAFNSALSELSSSSRSSGVSSLSGTSYEDLSPNMGTIRQGTVRVKALPPPEIDSSEFNFVIFADTRFRGTINKPKGFSVRSKKVHVNMSERLAFTKDPIKDSLLELTSEDFLPGGAAYKIPIEMFLNVMRYMEDYPRGKKTREQVVYELIEPVLCYEELHDELFCQIIKQITRNQKKPGVIKGWELLSLCAGTFKPSEELFNYLIAFFQEGRNNNTKEVARLASDALDRLSRLVQAKITRRHPPSSLEIRSVCSGSQVVCKIQLLDGSYKSIFIDSVTTAREALVDMIEKCDLKQRDGWALYESIIGAYERERALGDEEILCDVMSYFEHFETPKNLATTTPGAGPTGSTTLSSQIHVRFLFKKRLFLSPQSFSVDPRTDKTAFHLIYYQTIWNILTGRQPVSREDAAILAALQLQSQFGNYDPNKGVNLRSSDLRDYLPAVQIPDISCQDWCQLITDQYSKLNGVSVDEARLRYVNKCRSWKLYGSNIFFVEQKNQPIQISLAINRSGLHLLERGSLEPFKSLHFKEISNWSPAENGFGVVAGNLVKPVRLFWFTEESSEISSVFQAFVDAIIEEKKNKQQPAQSGQRRPF